MAKSKNERMAEIADEVENLTASPLYGFRQEHDYHAVIGEGDVDAAIMFIGEAPGKREAESGRPFVGAAGRVLDELLALINLRRNDVYITNIVKDRPPENRDPRQEELDLYAPFLLRQIEIIEPEVIATLGRFSMDFILEQFDVPQAGQKISDLHGQVLHADTPYGRVAVVPLFHPAVALYNRSQRETLEEDMQTLVQFLPDTPRRAPENATAEASGSEERPSNDQIAELLEHIADLLDVQDTNPFRVRAYRRGAQTARQTEQSLARLVRQGDQEALEALPDIGRGLANVITEFVETGRSSQLADLTGAVSPEDLFATVPGIGEELAERIATELDIHTLEELEQAAHDGRLDAVEGFGPKRVEAVKATLAGTLSRSAQRHRQEARAAAAGAEPQQPERPPVALLLDIDARYRQKAAAGELPTIAPRRFNPDDKAWLPIMRTEEDGWSFTVLFSNTAQAHELDKTDDWVVIYYRHDGREAQNTVVTETKGPLAGKRVVRGREAETRAFYEAQEKVS